MDEVLCRALESENVAQAQDRLSQVISATEAMHADQDPNYSNAIGRLVSWLMESGCIGSVTVNEGLLKSQPPQKILVLKPSYASKNRTLELRLSLGSQLEVLTLDLRD